MPLLLPLADATICFAAIFVTKHLLLFAFRAAMLLLRLMRARDARQYD